MDELSKRKFLRTLLLLLAGLLVVTASASIYNILYMQASSIQAETAKVQFVTASDSTVAGATIGTNGTYVAFSNLSGWPNATRVYEAAVGIKNFDTAEHIIELKFGSWSGSTTKIDYIYVKIFDSSGTQRGSTVTIGVSGSSTGPLSIPADATWRVQWEIKWKAEVLSTDSVSVMLQLIVN
ncbi:MAG: hypothetical protein QXK18_06100 [Candidatus Bathyarchaeia archaeon]